MNDITIVNVRVHTDIDAQMQIDKLFNENNSGLLVFNNQERKRQEFDIVKKLFKKLFKPLFLFYWFNFVNEVNGVLFL